MASEVRTYRVKPDETGGKRKSGKWTVFFSPLLVTAIILYLKSTGVVSELVGLLLILGVSLALGLFVRKKNWMWQDYELTIGPDYVEQKGPWNHVARIPKDQILGLSEQRDYVLVVARGGHAMVSIPRQLQGFDEVVGELRMWHGLEDNSALRFRWLMMVGPYFLVAAVHVGAPYLPPLVAMVAYLLAVGILLWHAYLLRREAAESDQEWKKLLPLANLFVAAVQLIEAYRVFSQFE